MILESSFLQNGYLNLSRSGVSSLEYGKHSTVKACANLNLPIEWYSTEDTDGFLHSSSSHVRRRHFQFLEEEKKFKNNFHPCCESKQLFNWKYLKSPPRQGFDGNTRCQIQSHPGIRGWEDERTLCLCRSCGIHQVTLT